MRGFADLRVMRGSNQVPYIVQRTSISRAITPAVTLTNDAKNPKLSRWLIKLPKSNLPLTRLTCATTTPLFQRSMSLSVEFTDERGDTFPPAARQRDVDANAGTQDQGIFAAAGQRGAKRHADSRNGERRQPAD